MDISSFVDMLGGVAVVVLGGVGALAAVLFFTDRGPQRKSAQVIRIEDHREPEEWRRAA